MSLSPQKASMTDLTKITDFTQVTNSYLGILNCLPKLKYYRISHKTGALSIKHVSEPVWHRLLSPLKCLSGSLGNKFI